MLVPVVLPFQITFYVMLALLVVLPFLLRRFTKHPILFSFVVCAMVCVPTFLTVGSIVDSIRYGEFHHPDASLLNDGYVELPAGAIDITLRKYASGHELKFQTDLSTLESWMDDQVDQWLEFADATPFELDSAPSPDEFTERFKDRGWTSPLDVVLYRGWRSGRGGGYDVWYSEAEQTAFISAGYW